MGDDKSRVPGTHFLVHVAAPWLHLPSTPFAPSRQRAEQEEVKAPSHFSSADAIVDSAFLLPVVHTSAQPRAGLQEG